MRKIALNKGILDQPNSAHKTHLSPTPYLGGIAIIIGVVFVTYTSLFLSNFTLNNFISASSLIGPALALGLIGLWDDIKNLSPFPRFIGQSIAALVVSLLLIVGNNFGNPTGSMLLDVLITIIWIIGICNSINFFDNLDGGAAGTTAISAIALTYLAINNGQTSIAALALVLSGATLGFLIWNKPPARIYMGDAGALFLGVLLATLSIRLNPSTDSKIASFATPILILAVPILDTTVAVVSRLRRKVSPFQGGRDHLSHRLIRAGVSRKLTVVILWALSVGFSFIAICVSKFNSSYETVWIFIALVLWVGLFIRFINTADD
jgi:UDP-GlcNAc:undecaprenyl-phosphate GlcNAc-1-phosphate transferase